MSKRLPKGMYKLCDCKAQVTCSHAFWVGYKPKGKRRQRASVDDLAGREIRALADAIKVQTAFKAAIDGETYIPKQKLRDGGPTVGEAFSHFVREHYVEHEMIIVPRGARKQADGESYLEWLHAVLGDYIARQDADPDLRARARNDRARLAIPRRIVERWGAMPVRQLSIDDGRDFKRDLMQPAKFWARSREPKLRAVATINRTMSVAITFGDWLARIGPAHGTTYRKSSPFRIEGRLAITQDAEDNKRTRRVPPEEEIRLIKAATPALAELIQWAIDSMMRRSEIARLRVGDVLERPQWVRVAGTARARVSKAEGPTLRIGARVNKTAKTRYVPVCTDRMQAIIEAHLHDAAGRAKDLDEYLFCDGTGRQPMANWDHQWDLCRLRANGVTPTWEPVAKIPGVPKKSNSAGLSRECQAFLRQLDLRFHDLRAEGISRQCEMDTPESQVGWMAGNPSAVHRYNRRRDDAIFANARRVNAVSEQIVKNLSSSQEVNAERSAEPAA